MIADRISQNLPNGQVDVCVIGSGPAGAVAAVQLSRAGMRVLVLEAGGVGSGGLAADTGLGRVDVEGAAETAFGRAFQLGGSSNLWAGRIAQLAPEDFAARPNVPLSEWPVTHAAMVPYYVRARSILEAPDEPNLDAVSGFEALFRAEGIASRPFVWARTPFRSGDWLRAQMKSLPNLSVTLDAQVKKLRQDRTGLVTAVQIRRPDGSTSELKARLFVLAAGGLEAVRLLFNSTDHCESGLGNELNMLGRCFSSHPKANIALLKFSRPFSVHNPVFTDTPWQSGWARIGIGISADAQYESGSLNHYLQLSPLAEYRASRAFELVKGHAAIQSSILRRQPAMHGLLTGLGLWGFNMIGRVARVQRHARLAVVRGFFDQRPDLDNRLVRSDKSDAAGMPLLDIRWRFTREDRRSVFAFLERIDEAVRHSGLGHLDTSALRSSDKWELTALHSHFMGATRMGTDPRKSYTDQNGQVHGTSNLFVAGPSLFPTYGYANPVLTIMALSLRMADHIVSRKSLQD